MLWVRLIKLKTNRPKSIQSLKITLTTNNRKPNIEEVQVWTSAVPAMIIGNDRFKLWIYKPLKQTARAVRTATRSISMHSHAKHLPWTATFKMSGMENTYVQIRGHQFSSNKYKSRLNLQVIFSITIFEKCGHYFR